MTIAEDLRFAGLSLANMNFVKLNVFFPVMGAIGFFTITKWVSSELSTSAVNAMPVSADKVSFEEGELKKRMMLQEEGGFSTESMRESQVRLDYALKQILNRAAVRCGETNVKTITATTVQSVLRPYTGKTMYTAIVPPLGLVREAQRQAVLGYPEADKNKADAEKELCRESSKAALEKEQALQRKGKDKKGKGK